MKDVAYTNAGRRQFRGLDVQVQGRIREKLSAYAETGEGNVVALQGVDGARLRVGDYRVIFLEDAETITVVAVGHRREVYR